jgi:catechol 2,3-dioxygenase-like lactoylglutathione lyase family enzyme
VAVIEQPFAPLNRILAIRLTTHDQASLARFYVEAIGFRRLGDAVRIGAEEMATLGLAGGGMRLSLQLGAERLDLDQFDAPGRPYPKDADAADLRFQHFAMPTFDAACAYGRAISRGATRISTAGPVALPASSGGVTAVKLRDPEGHPLEFLQFPGDANVVWNSFQRTGARPLGIDHSAISVGDIDASRRFYLACGLGLNNPTLNQGPAQADLDGLAAPVVDVAPLKPPGRPTPHLELLAYHRAHSPKPSLAANDVAATRILWASDRAGLLRDRDDHLHQLQDGF